MNTEKKTSGRGTLNVRIDPALLAEFLEVCQANDVTASQIVRHAIKDFIAAAAAQRK